MRLNFRCFLLVPVLLLWSEGSIPAPFIPANDSVVLERLPFKASDPTTREMRRLRDELSNDPNNLDIAIVLSRRYYQLALADGDPRFIGYAQAALAPWWPMAEPPIPVLVQRATLRQYNHDFNSALADLNLATRHEPRNGTAWSLLAAIHMVQAEYAAARKDCENMRGLASELIVLACVATVDNLSGQAAQSYATLRTAYEETPTATPGEKLWVITRLAEMADRLGRSGEAEVYFEAALELDIADAYLLAVYAEFLLDENRMPDVVKLLKGKERSDVLLVRLALAEKALALPQAREHEAAIRARFDAARMRGDKLHIQDEARFQLYFMDNAIEALRLAQENWQTQHEPSDARMLLEAALAAKDMAAAKPALEWLAQSKIEDRHLEKLAKQISQLGVRP
jgi:Tfp pilus assembly protein PilF